MKKRNRYIVSLLIAIALLIFLDVMAYYTTQRYATLLATASHENTPPKKIVADFQDAPPHVSLLFLESYDPKRIKYIFSPPKPPEPVYTGYCLTVPVLMYHHVQPQAQAVEKKQTTVSMDSGVFDQHMAYLASRGYNTITVKQLVDALRTKTALPPKSIAITLDDGYRDAYEYAYQSFKRYNITANLMIPTGLLEGADYLTWGQLIEMKGSGLIYVSDHTWSHYGVGGTNAEKIKYEIMLGKSQLEGRLGQPQEIFTYPYGTFGNTAIEILKQNGFSGAFSTLPGTVQCDSFIMSLHRTRIGNSPLSAYGL